MSAATHGDHAELQKGLASGSLKLHVSTEVKGRYQFKEMKVGASLKDDKER